MKDERIQNIPILKKILQRPDFASIAGFGFVIIFFMIAGDSSMFNLDGIINWTIVAAYLGIIAVGACLLMIAGEFDLSVGSMIGFAGIAFTIPIVYWDFSPTLSLISSLILCLFVGFLNGYLVVKTKLPSFIITLASLFMLRGFTLALAILFTNQTIISGLDSHLSKDIIVSTLFSGHAFTGLFSWFASIGFIASFSDGEPIVTGIPKVIIWWIVVTAIGVFILKKTVMGNWIFASGGDSVAASNIGVPTNKVKILMFVATAFCAWLFAILQVSEVGSAAADRGLLKEFEAIIAVVIGGALLTGGYGSIIGAFFGALIFGIVQIGITYTDITSDWFRVFLGLVLLISVIFNNYIREKITKST